MGFFLTIIYVLIIMIRPQEFVSAIRAWPILDVIAVLSLGASFMEGRISGARLGRSASTTFVLLFLIWCGLSHVRMGNFGLILDSWTEFAKTAIVFYLVVLNVDTFRRIKLFTWILILSTTVLALQGIWLFYTGSAFGSAEAIVRGDILQVQGIGVFNDPNDLGLHLVTWVPFLMPAFHRPFLSPTMWTGLVIMVPIITGLALTRSRGSMLGAAMVFWFYFYKRVGTTISIFGLVLILAAIMTLPRMSSISTKEASARSRMEHWSEGMKMFRWRPISGVGHNQFLEHHVQTAHSSFVLVFSELGLGGVFLWFGMFFSAFRDIYFINRDPRPPPDLVQFSNGLIGALITWHTCAFFLSHSYKFLSFVLVAMVVGLLTSLDSIGIHVENPWTKRQTMQTVYLTIGSMVMFYVLLRFLWRV